jgi:TRAP-type C4-dicarboxylate transport system permease small subunit
MGLLSNNIRNAEKGVNKMEAILAYMGAAMLFIMMLLGAIDVIGRYLFNSSISGTIEINKNLMAGVVVFSWALTQAKRAHASVEFIVECLSSRMRAVSGLIGDVLSLIFFGLVTWQSYEAGILAWQEQRYFQLIDLPVAVMYFTIAFGALVTCLLIFFQLKNDIRDIRMADKKEVTKPGQVITD